MLLNISHETFLRYYIVNVIYLCLINVCVELKYEINDNEYNPYLSCCFSSFFYQLQNTIHSEDYFKPNVLCILYPVLMSHEGKFFLGLTHIFIHLRLIYTRF